jgi:hypothetical protein
LLVGGAGGSISEVVGWGDAGAAAGGSILEVGGLGNSGTAGGSIGWRDSGTGGGSIMGVVGGRNSGTVGVSTGVVGFLGAGIIGGTCGLTV